MIIDLVPLWTIIIGAAVFFYVLLDGFDLGVGMLYALAPDRKSRNLVMNSISPVWDGNETWLILGGIGLLAAFPLAFAIIIPAVYLPIFVMLLALIFRGVAFEFHYRDVEHTTFWDLAFSVGSLIATFSQGIILGAFIQGFDVQGRNFAGSIYDCITPFSIFTGIALVFGYGLLGACWLILKTEGALQNLARKHARICFLLVIIAVAIVSIWTPLQNDAIRARWFSWPNLIFLSPVPIITLFLAMYAWKVIQNKKYELAPFLTAVALFLMSYIGIAISLFPLIVPTHFNLWQAASSTDTQIFLIIGTMFLLPIILMYSAWSYWVFRGKVKENVGYH